MPVTETFDIASVRARFGALADDFAFFDGPGGTQTPDEVGDAIARSLREASANLGAPYATSHRVQATLEEAERGAAAYVGGDAHEITFGQNMTSLNFALSRTASREWAAGDRVIVSALDHDANVAPWLELARDHELDVATVGMHPDTTLDLDDLRAKLTDRTRVVAFTAASNAVGTLTPVSEIARLAHDAGALCWVDAVHFAAHEAVDVRALDVDVLLCSTYKFCGPHLGFAYVRGSVADRWRPYRVRPGSSAPTGRLLSTGTPPFEALAGLNATFAYLTSIGGHGAIAGHERELARRMLDRLPETVRVYGRPDLDGRVPTFLLGADGLDADAASAELARRRIGVWSSTHWYSLGLHASGLIGDGTLRVGISHYNTAEEVDRLVAALGDLVSA